jgi:magnesium chelatase subunit D
MDAAKEALLLLAVDPGLKGLLITCGPGTAKSVLARAFPALLDGAPFVEVPLGVTEDRLLGGLDLERTLLTGTPQVASGLLARARGGILYVDEIGSIERRFAHYIAGALNTGIIRVERDGVSAEYRSDFMLIGTCRPNDSNLNAALVDAAGLHVVEPGPQSADERAEILNAVAGFDRHPAAFVRRYAAATSRLRSAITQARSRLPDVVMMADDYARLSATALELGIEGHRADIFAVRAARAHAALAGHNSVQDEDLNASVRLVLLPRAAVVPQGRPETEADHGAPQVEAGDHEDRIIPPIDEAVPEGALDPPHRNVREKAVRRGGAKERKSAGDTNWNRGRYVRAVAARPEARKVAIGATLLAAAPFQVSRRGSGVPGNAIRVEAGDLRFKQFRQRSGVLVIFAVDASGSMAVNRIGQAKGTLLRLLEKAYVHRDRFALISFRGRGAEVMLPPGRSVELAKRATSAMAVGGGTPLAAGLECALNLARRAKDTDGRRKLLVLLTDGRANVACRGDQSIWEELRAAGEALQSEGVASVVIDTRPSRVQGGEAERLAGFLGGRHVHLPSANADTVSSTVAAMADLMRERRT